MKLDPGTNFEIAEGLSAKARASGTYYTESVDHAKGQAAAFFLSAGTVGSTVDMALQYSDDDAAWSLEPDTTYGNGTAITQLTAAGTGQINAANPRARYSRCRVVSSGTCEFGVVSVLGPKRHVAAE